jgi:hypothetical protein
VDEVSVMMFVVDAVTSTTDVGLPDFEFEVIPGGDAGTQRDIVDGLRPKPGKRCGLICTYPEAALNGVTARVIGQRRCGNSRLCIGRCYGDSRHICLRCVLDKTGDGRIAALTMHDSPKTNVTKTSSFAVFSM